MKKLITIPVLALILIFASCEDKETNDQLNGSKNATNSEPPAVSEYMEEGTYREEVEVSNGDQVLYLAISSDDSLALYEYLETTEFRLLLDVDDIDEIVSNNNEDDWEAYTDDIITEQPKVNVDLAAVNIDPQITSYSLEVASHSSGSKYLQGYPVGYSTSNDFIGAVHLGWGSEFFAQLMKKDGWGFWNGWDVLDINGVTAWWVYPSNPYYIALDNDYSFYKRGIRIYPDRDQTLTNYRIVYKSNEFYGHDCAIGWYDGAHCQIFDTPPAAKAFFWGPHNSNWLGAYYTPVNGNECPVNGSWFDSQNCFVSEVPLYLQAKSFKWKNNLYVMPEVIPTK